MMMRDEAQMALQEVEKLSLGGVHRYTAAAKRVEDKELAVLFDELAAERQRQAEELADHIRATGDLPCSPDPDREDVHELFSSLRSLLTGDQRISLIDECIADEARLEEAVSAALKCDASDAALSLLSSMRLSAERAKRQLEEHRPA
jgi:uncharacterized protein (TIGR02284 family)